MRHAGDGLQLRNTRVTDIRQLPGGEWEVARVFGPPKADRKRMAIDLSGLFKSDDHRVRIHIGQSYYSTWILDRVMLDDSPQVPYTMTEVAAVEADLHFKGNLTKRGPDSDGDGAGDRPPHDDHRDNDGDGIPDDEDDDDDDARVGP